MCRKITFETLRSLAQSKQKLFISSTFSGFIRRQNSHPNPVFYIMSIVILLSVAVLTFRSLAPQKEDLPEGKEKIVSAMHFPAIPTEAVSTLGKFLKLQTTLNILSKDSMTRADSLAIRSSLREMQQIDSLLQQKLK